MARERLREFGITAEVVTLSHAASQARYAVEVLEPMTLSSLAYRSPGPRHTPC
ncbi:hypothetical protein [Paractinoplanes durhamensis]|uniref:hypothetical protein n=1 Tax=Paractinoplanes durhamensis TaxID=113563 RepID=UPI003644451B